MNKYILSLLALALTLALQTASAQAPARRVFPDSEAAEAASPRRALRQVPEPERVAAQVGVRRNIPRIPVIMVQFSDFAFHRTPAEVDSLFNARDYTEVYPHAAAVGSIAQYFEDQSMGQYRPVFDIYGPVTVEEGCCASFANKANVRTLVKEACSLADSIVDFSQYDADHDGQIDLVYIYYAGFASSDGAYIDTSLVSNPAQLIWPHWSTTSGATYDGLRIRDYECANELDGYNTVSLAPASICPAGIGVAVHEFCHAIGLPDLYETTGTEKVNPLFKHFGAYDVMDYSCYNDEMFCPSSLSAYERWFLGWLTPTLLSSPQDVELGYLGDTNEAYLITADGQPLSGPHDTTVPYYLLENRQKRKWDAGRVFGYDILGHGMMLTCVTYDAGWWSTNTVNRDSLQQGLRLICADGDYSIGTAPNYTKWYGKKGDLFPRGATEFQAVDSFPITDITEDADGVIRFKFMGGAPDPGTAVEDADASSSASGRKLLIDGRVIIERYGRRYSLLGQPMD